MAIYFIKKFLKSIYWSVYGETIRNPPLPFPIKSILFVCKGNICRSPFAERIANTYPHFKKEYSFSSVGIRVNNPISPPTEAIIAAKKFGVTLENHKSRRINYSLMESYNMIIAMDASHYKYLRKTFLEFRGKIFLLPLFEKISGTSADKYSIFNIKDPYGKTLTEFHECFKRIENSLIGLFDYIKERNEAARKI